MNMPSPSNSDFRENHPFGESTQRSISKIQQSRKETKVERRCVSFLTHTQKSSQGEELGVIENGSTGQSHHQQNAGQTPAQRK